MNFADFTSNTAATAKGLVKILLQSRCTSIGTSHPVRPLIVMGNGPSLADAIDRCVHLNAGGKADLLAVNFAANAPQFSDLRPQYYVLVDPLFFRPDAPDNVRRLFDNLARVSWPMTLIVPATFRRRVSLQNPSISVCTINALGIEGFDWFTRLVYNAHRGMPRPRNVLIPSIMSGLWLGYSTIYLVGADHSWMQSIWVNDDNRVISVQPHFYKENPAEQARIDAQYAGYRLHHIIHSFYVAFEAYHRIARYATGRHVRILNATPSSYIDAFPRSTLAEV